MSSSWLQGMYELSWVTCSTRVILGYNEYVLRDVLNYNECMLRFVGCEG